MANYHNLCYSDIKGKSPDTYHNYSKNGTQRNDKYLIILGKNTVRFRETI